MADTINDLNENVPTDVNLLSDIPPDLRGTKKAIQGTFAGLATGGVVSVSATELNHMAGVTSNVQAQIDAKEQPVIWTFRSDPDIYLAPLEQFFLASDAKYFIAFGNVGSTQLQHILPDKNSVVDGAFCIFTSGVTGRPVDLYRVDGFSGQSFRFLVNKTSDPSFNQWVSATTFQFNTPIPRPHILGTFSSHYDQWVVRVVNSTQIDSWS